MVIIALELIYIGFHIGASYVLAKYLGGTLVEWLTFLNLTSIASLKVKQLLKKAMLWASGNEYVEKHKKNNNENEIFLEGA